VKEEGLTSLAMLSSIKVTINEIAEVNFEKSCSCSQSLFICVCLYCR